MIFRRLISSCVAVFVTLHAGQAAAQAPPFPQGGAAPLIGAPSQASAVHEACLSGFTALRDEAERRGRLVKAASKRKAPAEEACKVITSFGKALVRMINYVETNAAKCAIPRPFIDKMHGDRKNTEALLQKVCPAAPLVSDVGDPATENQCSFRIAPPSKTPVAQCRPAIANGASRRGGSSEIELAQSLIFLNGAGSS